MSKYGVILFDSTHDAIYADKTLRELLNVTLMPTPRRFSESCGIALRFDLTEQAKLEALMNEHHVHGHIHPMDE